MKFIDQLFNVDKSKTCDLDQDEFANSLNMTGGMIGISLIL